MVEEKVLEMRSKTVSQKSRLGNLGLLCLLEAGFVGPPYSLKDISVDFYPIADSIDISFYDMSTTINSENKYYNEIKDCLIKRD